MSTSSHTKSLTEEALDICLQFDWENAGLEPPDRLPNYFARLANRWLKKRGFIVRHREHTLHVDREFLSYRWARQMLLQTHVNLLRDPEAFDHTYDLLEDEESQKTFDWYVQHRFAAPYLFGLADTVFPAPVTRDEFMRVRLEQKEVARATGFPVFNLTMLALGQYSLPQYGANAEPGDVVIDAGAGLGDTAWLFHKQVGSEGKIYAFEPIRSQQAAIKANCQAQNWENVEIVPYGLWDKRETTKISEDAGRSTLNLSETANTATQEIETVSLDLFVKDNQLQQVDFIKMDIEGAEQNALQGCREVIERFSPKLAISVYHLADDIVRIPSIINGMNANYRFYLRHYTYFFGDTILYGVPA